MSDKVTKVQTGAFAESKNLTTVHFSSKTSQLFESACEQLRLSSREGAREASLAELKEAAFQERYGNWMVE